MQSLPCSGCNYIFKSAAALMHHIERDECPKISRIRLIQEQSKKFMIKEALNDGMGLSLPIIPNMAGQDDPDPDDMNGGVKIGVSEAGKQEMNNREAIANQPNPDQDDPTSSVSAMLALKHWPSLGENAPKGKSVTPSDLMAFSEMSISGTDGKENVVWKGKAAARLGVESTTPRRPFGVGIPDAGQTLRILDNSWDATKFFNTFTGKYVCTCKQSFAVMRDFEEHVLMKSRAVENKQQVDFQESRLQTLTAVCSNRCPGCLRIFKTTSALIAHFEAPSARCDINDSQRYGQILDELTGGIIQASGFNEDGTVKYEAGKLELNTTTVSKDLRQHSGTQKW
jgi:hypothetical protein